MYPICTESTVILVTGVTLSLIFLFKLVDKWSLVDFSILAVFIGLQLQRGHIQIAYYTWMMIGLYLVVNFINHIMNNKTNYLKLSKKYFFIFLSLFLGICISLNLYYPVLKYSYYSTRGSEGGGIGILNATQWSFSLQEFITLIFPSIFGFGGQLYWGGMPFTDYPNYMGIFLFIFAIYALFKSKIDNETSYQPNSSNINIGFSSLFNSCPSTSHCHHKLIPVETLNN